ncbi:MAG: hypothetical protein EOM00_15460 [Clostridia bacterium]|nr:hypothetical protein [Clostridia bacterium]
MDVPLSPAEQAFAFTAGTGAYKGVHDEQGGQDYDDPGSNDDIFMNNKIRRAFYDYTVISPYHYQGIEDVSVTKRYQNSQDESHNHHGNGPDIFTQAKTVPIPGYQQGSNIGNGSYGYPTQVNTY